MWNGSNEDKRRALLQFLRNDENLEVTEAAMKVTRRKVNEENHTRQWLTIREMHDKKYSLRLALNNCEKMNAQICTYIYIYVPMHALTFLHAAWMCMHQLRAKIKACVARGGRADPDAPNDPESTRYRVSVEMEEKEKWHQEHEMSMHTNLDPRSAVQVMATAEPASSTVHAPDPMALVREQLQNLQQQCEAPQTPGQQSAQSSSRAGRCFWCN